MIKTKQTKTETFKIKSHMVLEKIKEIIKEGNARRIIIKDKNKKVLMEFPLTIGIVGVALAPILVVIGTVTALIIECSVVVEREI